MIETINQVLKGFPRQLDDCEPDALFVVWREPDGRVRMAMHKTDIECAKMIMDDIGRNDVEAGNIANGWQLVSKVTEK